MYATKKMKVLDLENGTCFKNHFKFPFIAILVNSDKSSDFLEGFICKKYL